MESYEEFCSRSLDRLQTERKGQVCGHSSGQQEAFSIIRFHGRAVLAPLLSVEQRREMTQYRQRAAQLEADKQSLRRTNLLARVQDIIDNVQVRKGTEDSADSMNGFTLLPSLSSPPWSSREGVAAEPRNRRLPMERKSLTLPNGTGEGMEGEEEDGVLGGGPSLSLQSLLKKSRAYLEQEQSRRGSWGSVRCAPAQADSLSDKENESSGGLPGSDTECSPGSPLGCLPHSLTGSYARLPSPEPSLSPRPHRRRTRPISAGNILISTPTSAAELSPGKAGEGPAPGRISTTDSRLPPRVSLQNSSLTGDGPFIDLGIPVSTSAPSPAGQDGAAPGFRRRSYTLDSPSLPGHAGPHVDWTQERTPRFLGAQPQRAPNHRSPPVALNQSYDVESPSPTLQRPHVITEPSFSLAKHRAELEGSYESGTMLSALSSAMKEQHRTSEEVQRRFTALEEVRRQMEEEHAHQLSLLIAEQEREQHRLQQELEEKEWRLRGGPGGAQTPRDSLTPAERSPAHSIVFPSLLSPGVPSPAVQSFAYRLGPGKVRSRLNQVITPEQQRALCRLSALVRGFLTRRLLKTEKLKQLRQTVVDTHEFLQTLQTEAPLKRGPFSAQDISLQERLKAQLRAALYDVHDMFFVMPLGERLGLLQQDRELRAERKLRQMEKARSPRERGVLSAATQRSLDRRKQRVSNTSGNCKKLQPKSKSPPINRVLQPSQGLNAPLPGQPHKHGSLNRKNPEERVKRTDMLKKQSSLG